MNSSYVTLCLDGGPRVTITPASSDAAIAIRNCVEQLLSSRRHITIRHDLEDGQKVWKLPTDRLWMEASTAVVDDFQTLEDYERILMSGSQGELLFDEDWNPRRSGQEPESRTSPSGA